MQLSPTARGRLEVLSKGLFVLAHVMAVGIWLTCALIVLHAWKDPSFKWTEDTTRFLMVGAATVFLIARMRRGRRTQSVQSQAV